MKNYKYEIRAYGAHLVKFGSNSRNARKHLYETNAFQVDVYDKNGELVCRAKKQGKGMVLVGTVPKQ